MLFVGDDWAEDHHDVEIVDDEGAGWRGSGCPRAWRGSPRLHEMVAEHLHEDWADPEPGTLAPGEGGDRDRPRSVGRRIARGGL